MVESEKTNELAFQARHYPVRLSLRQVAALMEGTPHSQSPLELAYQFAPLSHCFIFNFGTIVFFNVPQEKQNDVLSRIRPMLGEAVPKTTEDFIVEIDSSLPKTQFHEMGFNKVRVRELKYKHIRLLGMLVSESTALDYFEDVIENMIQKSRHVSNQLKLSGKTGSSMKEMLKFIGEVLSTKQEIIADLYVVDAPDETWDDQVLDRLYGDLKRLFEIETRYRVLEFKLEMVQDTVEVIADLLRFEQETILELIVIALIAVEIVWFFVEYAFKK